MTSETIDLTVDLVRNTLRFRINSDDDDGALGDTHRQTSALLDVGEGGRLLGLEIAQPNEPEPFYLELETSGFDQARSVTVLVDMWESAEATIRQIEIPRRGDGYEITYPSGNQ